MNNMSHLTPEVKHHLLLEYSSHDTTQSFSSLAARHGIKGGKRTVQRWYQQWDGTVESLKRKEGSGKHHLLSRVQVSRHIRAPILAANRSHRSIHYTDLLPQVQQKTGIDISIQTLRRYGKEELGVKQRRSKKRTADESK